jgi:S-adenosylmethionine decarboxylase
MRVNILHNKGNHFVVDGFSSCDLGNVDLIRDFILDLIEVVKMNAISEPMVIYHEADDEKESGVTGVVILAESNITIHTYPTKKWFALDIYSCNEFDIDKIVEFLKKSFGLGKFETKILKRGFYNEED